LIIAASEGSRAAIGVNMYLTQQEFLTSWFVASNCTPIWSTG
jgi:hypothetical protein